MLVMRSSVAASALALAATTLVSAAPALPQNAARQTDYGIHAADDGFPNPSQRQLKRIEEAAFGTLPNAAPPTELSDDTLTSLRLIAFNELFEVAFFESMLANLTNDAGYFNIPNLDKHFAISTVASIVAVEKLHATNANAALVNVGHKSAIRPCKYRFPADNFKDAIDLAARFTDLVLGTLQDVLFQSASNRDAALAPSIGSVIGNEAEQDGWFRSIRGRRPNAQPFLTSSTRHYAFSALQDFAVPGSCAAADANSTIDLKVFQPLTAAADPPATARDIAFSFPLNPTRPVPAGATDASNATGFWQRYGAGLNLHELTVSYLSGLDAPVSVPLESLELGADGVDVRVTAAFPQRRQLQQQQQQEQGQEEGQEGGLFFGLVVAALTVGGGFESAAEMVDATVFGPALLEVQEGGGGA